MFEQINSQELNQPVNPEVARENDERVQTKEELLRALQSDFATAVTKVYINSLDREYAFREITVQEQKFLTRTMSANENRKDLIYDSQCAIINKAALDKTFDIYKLSEFDRLKLLLALYHENMFQNNVKYICEECGTENQYKVDFTNTLARLDEYKLEQKEFEYENSNFKYKFLLEYPSVQLVSKFHAAYCRRHGSNIPKRQSKSNDVMNNLEYINLFIKSVEFTSKNNGSRRQIVFGNYKVSDMEDILATFPQDVLYTEKGVMKYIVNEYIKTVNDTFDKHKCVNCGAIHEKGDSNSAESFF